MFKINSVNFIFLLKRFWRPFVMRSGSLQKQIQELEDRSSTLDSIVAISKTSGGRITDNGKNLIYILRKAGLSKSKIAKILDVTPASLTPYE